MSVKLHTENNLEFLSLKGGCTGSSESLFVKMPHCWKSRIAAHRKTQMKGYYTTECGIKLRGNLQW